MDKFNNNIYHLIEARAQKKAQENNITLKRFILGLTWSCSTIEYKGNENIGLAMSPQEKSRTLQWPGTLAGKNAADITPLFHSWNNFESTLGLATCNAIINTVDNPVLTSAEIIPRKESANVSVFSHFLPKLKNKKIVVIGRYPNMNNVLDGLDYSVLERQPGEGDLPDTAADIILPTADWVFITATTLLNKTFSRICELSKNAVTVLMGPSLPWLDSFQKYHIDFIAGVIAENKVKTEQIVTEGGGTRIFEDGVIYAVSNISHPRLQQLKQKISVTAENRHQLKADMDTWYQQRSDRFPKWQDLEKVDTDLSLLDIAYKRLWDANQ